MMDQNDDTVTITEKNNLSLTQTLIGLGLGLILLVFIFVGWFWYQPNLVPENIPPTLEPSSPLVQGTLYISAKSDQSSDLVVIDGEPLPYVYTLDLESGAYDLLLTNPSYSFAPGPDLNDIVLGFYPEVDVKKVIQPSLFNGETGVLDKLLHIESVTKTGLVSSPDIQYYAYNYISSTSNEFVNFEISPWNIALHNFNTPGVNVISSAANPAFIDGNNVLYMRSNGIYIKNINSDFETQVLDFPISLTMIDDFSVSKDGTVLVLTRPSQSLMAVYEREANAMDSQFVEVATIGGTTSNVGYFNAKISPDHTQYAVLAINKADYQADEGRFSKATIEIRLITDQSVIKTFFLNNLIQDSINLEWWGEAN